MRSSIDGFIDAALLGGTIGAGTVSVPQRGDVNDVRIPRIDGNAADLARVLQTDVTPCGAGVGGFKDAVAGRKILANVGLAGSGIDGFRIGGSHGQRADRGHGLAVKNRGPDHSSVGGFPDPAIDRTKVKSCGVARHTGDGHRASAAERADQAPLEPGQQFRRNRLGKGSGGEQQKKTSSETTA